MSFQSTYVELAPKNISDFSRTPRFFKKYKNVTNEYLKISARKRGVRGGVRCTPYQSVHMGLRPYFFAIFHAPLFPKRPKTSKKSHISSRNRQLPNQTPQGRRRCVTPSPNRHPTSAPCKYSHHPNTRPRNQRHATPFNHPAITTPEPLIFRARCPGATSATRAPPADL